MIPQCWSRWTEEKSLLTISEQCSVARSYKGPNKSFPRKWQPSMTLMEIKDLLNSLDLNSAI